MHRIECAVAGVVVATILTALMPLPGAAAQADLNTTARLTLQRAVSFFSSKVSASGGYLWQYSADLRQREGENQATDSQAWVQPPGTPSVGEALLESYLLCREPFLLDAATAAGHALVQGQLVSGGWDYRIEFDPARRTGWQFRTDRLAGRSSNDRARNVTTLDDDTTQSALRFLMKLDTVLKQRDRAIHEAVEYGLNALLNAQYPNGAWPQRFSEPPDPAAFPVLPASYPDSWPRTHPRLDYRSYYTFNDNTIADMIDTMFLANELYQDPKYAAAAEKAGGFILLAQMPEPQPAWAQQYNADMQPAWARRFEPPAVTGGESQGVLRILMTLYQRTGNERYLKPIPAALSYLERSQLPDGRLARFYELQTNRPLYFTKTYQLTYDDDDLPTHYGFQVSSKLPQLRRQFERVRTAKSPGIPKWTVDRKRPSTSSALESQVRTICSAADNRGAWTEEGRLKSVADDGPRSIITTRTFMRNIMTLSRFIAATKQHSSQR